MSFLSWLRNWKRSRQSDRHVRQKRPTFQPRLESLEEREVLSFGNPLSISNSLFKNSHPVAQAVGDVNGDGKLDLITITNYPSSGVEVMLGKGTGQFGSPVSWSATGGTDTPTALALGDISGDGKLDIITGNDPGDGSYYGARASLSFLVNRGDGTFPSYLTYRSLTMSSGPTSLAVGDLDGDSRIDVVAAGDGEVDVAYHDYYWSSSTYNLPSSGYTLAPGTAAVGDLNADGKLDFVVTSHSVYAYVFLNTGLGFAGPQLYPAGNAVALGDVNGDGTLDLVTAGGSAISVLVNNGDGTFAAARIYPVNGSANSVALGDFNKDGKLDAAVAGGELDVLLNNGDGTFGTVQKAGPAGSQVLVADFNGDGFLDLCQIDATASSIDVVLNRADWQETSGQKGHK